METIINHSIVKNIGQIQSFQGITGEFYILHFTSTILHFKKMPTNEKFSYFLFMFERETNYH